jgi:hypothetical protein
LEATGRGKGVATVQLETAAPGGFWWIFILLLFVLFIPLLFFFFIPDTPGKKKQT